jgi:tetratricopeptide (TPR) repeat protein
MKKFSLLAAISLLMMVTTIAQPCISDAWMNLQNKQISKAKRVIDACQVGNENNADYWLMKANVYLQRYEEEKSRLEKNPKYVIKDTDAIWIANECFYKAVEIDPKVTPKSGLIDPIMGQMLCAGPFYDMGYEAYKKDNWQKAFKYLYAAVRALKLDDKNPSLPRDLGYIYFDLSQIARKLEQPDTYKKMLTEAVAIKTPIPEIYILLYDLYKEEKDTVKCANVIKSAKKHVPANGLIKIYELELEHLTMSGEQEKFIALADKLAEENPENISLLAKLALYMTNNDQFEKAETYLKQGLAIDSSNFELNQQMGYRYFFEAIKYQNLMDQATNDKDWNKLKELREAEKNILELAHTWVEKAYLINNDDRGNNIMLQQLKVKLLKEIPEELKEKVDSYKHD